jgi:hypothetical protein
LDFVIRAGSFNFFFIDKISKFCGYRQQQPDRIWSIRHLQQVHRQRLHLAACFVRAGERGVIHQDLIQLLHHQFRRGMSSLHYIVHDILVKSGNHRRDDVLLHARKVLILQSLDPHARHTFLGCIVTGNIRSGRKLIQLSDKDRFQDGQVGKKIRSGSPVEPCKDCIQEIIVKCTYSVASRQAGKVLFIIEKELINQSGSYLTKRPSHGVPRPVKASRY